MNSGTQATCRVSRSTTAKRSLSERVAYRLERELRRDHAPGDRLPSEAALAKRFEVSVLTLREALARLAEAGLVERRHGSGTYATDPGRNRHVAILIPLDEATPLANAPFFLRSVIAAQAFFRERNTPVRVYHEHAVPGLDAPLEPLPDELTQDAEAHRLRGVISLATSVSKRATDALLGLGVPVVGDGSRLPFQVAIDYGDMAAAGLAHLAAKGCRRVALLEWGLEDRNVETLYRRAGLTFDPRLIQKVAHPIHRGSGHAAFSALWDGLAEKPDGLLVCDEFLLADAAMAILERGIAVPTSLRIVSHALKGSAAFIPFPVTLMEYDPADNGRAMGELLLGILEGRMTKPARLTVGFEWVAAESPTPVQAAVCASPSGEAVGWLV